MAANRSGKSSHQGPAPSDSTSEGIVSAVRQLQATRGQQKKQMPRSVKFWEFQLEAVANSKSVVRAPSSGSTVCFSLLFRLSSLFFGFRLFFVNSVTSSMLLGATVSR